MAKSNISDVPDDGRQWQPLDDCGAFIDLTGPYYMSLDNLEPGEAVRFGFRVAAKHCNNQRDSTDVQVCHGGMLTTFLDLALARGIIEKHEVGRPLPTISLSSDFLSPAKLGEWIEARVELTRIGRGLCFAQAFLVGPRGPVLRGNAVFKRMQA